MTKYSKTLLMMAQGILLVSLPAIANDSENTTAQAKNTSVQLSFGLGGLKADSSLNKASVMGVNIGAKANHKITDSLAVDIAGGMNVQTGSSTTARDNNIYKPGNSNYLKEAKLTYTPLSILDLQAGVINQSVLDAPLLVGNKGFIAAKEGFKYKVLDTKISVFAMQAIPNNRNLSQRIDVEEDGDPRFFTETVKVEQELFVGTFELGLTHFAFSDISNAVAYESILLGNTGSPIDNGNGVLTNEYQGWHIAAGYSANINESINLTTKFNHLSNTAADADNTGYIAALGLNYTNNEKNYSVEISNFKIESDAAIAYYNSSKYGLANKQGNKLKLAYNNTESKLGASTEIIQNKVIKNNLYQADETIFILSLRKLYDLF